MSSTNPRAEDDIATQKINEIRQKTKDNFSEDEIQKFITMGKQLASKAVISAVINVIREGPPKGRSPDECERLVKKLELRVPYNYSGFVQCAFKEIQYLLNITLSTVDKDYRTDIDIPHASYARDLFSKYDFLKNTAVAYWRQFVEENPELFKRICDYRNDVDFTDLVVDEKNPTTLYFDPESKKRVGIFCYYVDHTGKPFYKRPTDGRK